MTGNEQPFSPTAGDDWRATLARETSRMWERFLDSHKSRGKAADSTPHEVIYQRGMVRVLRYRGQPPVRWAEPVLICFSLVNRPYILDLHAERSVIRQLLRQGLDVYLIDWGRPSPSDRRLRLADYVGVLMKDVADAVCRHAAARRVSLLGYCMGGTMSAMFTALHPERVRNLILLAAPIDFSGDESLLNLWTREEYFDVDGLIDAFGNCPGSLLQLCFQQMKPVQNYLEKYLTLSANLVDQSFLENFFAMERWANDNIPVAGETFRDFVKQLYRGNELVQGELEVHGRKVALECITCPLLLLTASLDHLVPVQSALAIKQHVQSPEIEEMGIQAGHIGLAVSSKAHRRLWPQAAAWIAHRSTLRGAVSG